MQPLSFLKTYFGTIRLAVMLSVRFPLSFRNVEKLPPLKPLRKSREESVPLTK